VIESIMYFGIGFLCAALFGLLVIPLVHRRAVRLTMRRLEGAVPLSVEEIQADKDQLRADFAMSTRRLEMNVEQLQHKSTNQLAELGRKADAINLLKSERDGQKVEISALKSQIQALNERLRNAANEVEVEHGFGSHLFRNRPTPDAIDGQLSSLQSISPNDQPDFVPPTPKNQPPFRNVGANSIAALTGLGAILTRQTYDLILRGRGPKGTRLPVQACDSGAYKLSAIEKQMQIEKELDAASERVEEMMSNTFSPKIFPLAMMAARAAAKWAPQPLALYVARKITASEDGPRVSDNLPSINKPHVRAFELMTRQEGAKKNASSFQRRARKDALAKPLNNFFSLATLSTGAAVGSFALIWYLLSSPWPLVLTLRHLAAYPNCEATEIVGLAPAKKGNPGYWSHNDADGDGVACK